jgi:glucosylglycerate synthase
MPEIATTVRQLIIGVPVGPDADDATLRQVSALASTTAGENRTVVVARPGAPASAGEERPDGSGVIDVPYTLRPQDAQDVPYHGVAGRARAVHAILTRAHAADAACLIVDPRAAEPAGWIDGFVQALTENQADFVGPVYGRHPFGSGLIHAILAPLFAALYGHRLQYPVGLHFACSARLVGAVLDDPMWDSGAAQPAIEWSLAAAAAAANLRMAEAPVTIAARDDRPFVGLSTTTAQLLGVVFADLERQVRVWQRIRGSMPVLRVGTNPAYEPAPAIDAAALAESFRSAYRDLHGVWEEVLPPLSIMQWRRLTTVSQDAFRVPDPVWARTLYDFTMGYRLRVIPRPDLLHSLTPLYLAWLASFVLETQGAPAEAVDARLVRVRAAFEEEKRYLVSQWRWPERFKPVKLRRQR